MLDELITTYMKEHHIPGLALAVVQEELICEMKGYGLANLEHDVLVTPDTVFELGSITKPFTAIAILHLVEQEKLSLDDKISSYLQDLPTSWSDITFRHLLTHTSGIPDYFAVIETSQSLLWQPHFTRNKIIEIVAELPLKFKPGELAEYSNTGFVLLGILIEQLVHQSYADFLKETLFEPLGMTAIRINNDAVIIVNRAQGYQLEVNQEPPLWSNRGYLYPTLWDNADGGLISSVTDLVKWRIALFNGNLLTQSSLTQMWTPTPMNSGKRIDYGLGWSVWTVKALNGCKCVGHEGRRPGFSASFMHFVDKDLTIIILCNCGKIYDVNLENLSLEIAGSSD